MKVISFCFILFIFNSAKASECKNSLKSILASAKSKVVQSFEKDTGCYNAALVGRLYGPPGCFPPEAFSLQSLLTPYLNQANAACSGVCVPEGLEEECKNLVNTNFLRQNGIQGILQILNSSEFN